ncbi:hypothetical protein [Tabrizicola sp.]|uniref:hypothetical protein n=1 Tax=Tabrizicola sp. TaxID=2005166 RepID=UPI001A4F7B29|nr:hypothetical protein [Tabrizicola sp.]MBL9074214.1 hypothetical protein [Tabrizicola sp.]
MDFILGLLLVYGLPLVIVPLFSSRSILYAGLAGFFYPGSKGLLLGVVASFVTYIVPYLLFGAFMASPGLPFSWTMMFNTPLVVVMTICAILHAYLGQRFAVYVANRNRGIA